MWCGASGVGSANSGNLLNTQNYLDPGDRPTGAAGRSELPARRTAEPVAIDHAGHHPYTPGGESP
jgi:hypothetical protein